MSDALLNDADNDGAPSPGDTLRYRVSIMNIGGQAATGVQFVYGANANTVLADGSVTTSRGNALIGGSAQNPTLTVDIGTIGPNNDQVEITFNAVIHNPLPALTVQVEAQGTVRSQGVADTPTDDPDRNGLSDPTVTEITASPGLAVEKTDFLLADANGDGGVSPGDTLIYVITLINGGNIGAAGVRVDDVLDPGTTLLAGSVLADGGNVTTGNTPGDTTVSVEVPELAGGGDSVIITFQAVVNTSVTRNIVTNQASVTYQTLLGGANSRTQVLSDDPDTTAASDATLTQLTGVGSIIFIPFGAR